MTTIQQALEDHLTLMTGEKEHKSHERLVKKLNGRKYDTKTRKVVDVFGLDTSQPLSSLTTKDVQSLVMARKKEGNSSMTIIQELLVLSQAIKHAKRMGHTIPDIDFADIKKANKLRPSKGRLRYLTEHEMQKLFREMYRKDLNGPPEFQQAREDAADFVVCSAYLGTRHTELATLRWDDVDMEKGVIHLYRPKVRNETILYMPAEVRKVMEKRIANRKNEYVFTGKDGGPRKWAPRALKSACRRAGLTDVSFHTLRHSLASRLVQNGLPIQAVQQILGHTSILTTQRYSHLAPAQASLQAMAVLDKLSTQEETQ